jgi:major membrane immunogen (membrane-anchored lipoprotein)
MSRSFVLLAVAIAMLTSCAKSDSVVGKWQTSGSDSPITWEFADNGAVTQGTTRGRYTLGDDKRLKIETPFAKSVYRWKSPAIGSR